MKMSTTMREYNVVYSPRGFGNELALRKFDTLAGAKAFKAGVNSQQDSYALDSTSRWYKSTVRQADAQEHDFSYGEFWVIFEDR